MPLGSERNSDDEVEALYRNLHIRKFKTRDEQEVAGYLLMLERIGEGRSTRYRVAR